MLNVMKHILKLTLAAVAILLCTATFAARDSKHQLRGSGNIITKEVSLSGDYTTILATKCVKVVMTEQEGGNILVAADDNVMEWVVCQVKGDILEVTVRKPDCNSYSDLNVTVTLPRNNALKRVEGRASADVIIQPTLTGEKKLFLRASSSANIVINRAEKREISIHASSASKVSGAFKAEFCAMNASSSADIQASVLADKVSLWASSSGTVKLSGAATALFGEASSSGDILCSELISQNASAAASSSGKVTLNCSGKLFARASSGGDVISTNASAASATAEAASGGLVKLRCHGTLSARAASGGDVKYSGDCTLEVAEAASGGSIKRF